MLLKLTNIGMLDEAVVEINGLTVIAGENNTGKSTIGKTFFSVVKAISRGESDLDENKEEKIRNKIWSLYRFLQIRFVDIVNFLPRMELYEVIRYHLKNNNITPILEILEDLRNYVHDNSDFDVNASIDSIINIVSESNSKQEVIKRALQKALDSTFLDEFCNKRNKVASIKIIDEGKVIFDSKIQNNKVETIDLSEELYFKDSTYIETPFVLDLSEQIRYSVTHFDINDDRERLIGRGQVSLRVKDLIDKLTFFSDDLEGKSSKNLFVNEPINEILNGHFQYNRRKREFLFKNEKATFRSNNVASGLKCFGILQMLDRNGFLDSRSLLILDEPEVHLHPKWQLAYAKIIVEFIKNGLNVIVTSHSPYMVEALKRFSEKENIKTNFYLSENEKIVDTEDALEKIFEKLSEPFDMFDEMDIEKING